MKELKRDNKMFGGSGIIFYSVPSFPMTKYTITLNHKTYLLSIWSITGADNKSWYATSVF